MRAAGRIGGGGAALVASALFMMGATPARAERFPVPPRKPARTALSATSGAGAAAAAFRRADAAVQRGLATRVYPGAVLVVGTHDRILYAKGYGRTTWRGRVVPSPARSLWDLASLTKVIATTGATARLVERGTLDLDDPVAKWLPQWTGGGREQVTLRMLLAHTSGLRPFLRFYAAPTQDSAWAMLWHEPLQRAPGTSAVYSDLNAILLGRVIEAATGDPLDVVVRREVIEPLGLTQTGYRPPESAWARAVPTGRDAGEPVVGVVNDRNADFLGGVTGHAGLFATGLDVAKVAQAWLAAASGRDSSWLRPATVARFLERTPGSGSRYLGWDGRDPAATPSSDPKDVSIFGRTAGPRVFGHTGWTGTMLWMDPDADRFMVFLTNRSYDPRRKDTFAALKQTRAAVSDAVAGPPPSVAAAPCRVTKPVC